MLLAYQRVTCKRIKLIHNGVAIGIERTIRRTCVPENVEGKNIKYSTIKKKNHNNKEKQIYKR